MKLARHFLLPALLLTLVLPGCKPSVRTLGLISVNESLFDEAPDADIITEARELVAHYIETGDANYATPTHGITMLHLAAATHRLWLVERLLAEGADPNARTLRKGEHGDTAACLAVHLDGWRIYHADALLIVQTLVKHGADINLGNSILQAAIEGSDDRWESEQLNAEQLAIELLKLGARPDETTAGNFVSHGWPKALQALKDSPEWKTWLGDVAAMLNWAAVSFTGDESQVECVRLLLQHATPEDVKGRDGANPLYTLAGNVSDHDERFDRFGPWINFAVLLLQHGADPLAPGGEFLKSCAADRLSLHSKECEELEKRGFRIEAPAHILEPQTLAEQLLDIPAAAITPEEIAEQYGTIAGIFTSPVEIEDQRGEALRLHHGIKLEGG